MMWEKSSKKIFGDDGALPRSLMLYERGREVVDLVMQQDGIVEPDEEIVKGLKSCPTSSLCCLKCTKTELLGAVVKCSREIGCSGCVQALKQSLQGVRTRERKGLWGMLFQVDEKEDELIHFQPRFRYVDSEECGKLFAAFHTGDFFSTTSSTCSKRHRCPLHISQPRIDREWTKIWENMSLQAKEKIALFEADEVLDFLRSHLEELRFCRDCRGNVFRALDFLVSFANFEELRQHENNDDTFHEPYFEPFVAMEKPRSISCDVSHVPLLIQKVQETDLHDEMLRVTGQHRERHASTLKDGQNELLNCIGRFFLSKIKQWWLMHSRQARLDEIMVWLTLDCMQTNLMLGTKTSCDIDILAMTTKMNKLDKRKKWKPKKKQKKNKANINADMNVSSLKWSEDAESRLLAQLNCTDQPASFLTEQEIHEGQRKLQEMVANLNSSRTQLRANLRQRFRNLCSKAEHSQLTILRRNGKS